MCLFFVYSREKKTVVNCAMENVCRTCLRISSPLISLYSDQNLIPKIETISSEQMVMGPDFPSEICRECLTNINKLFGFRKVIINSQKELQERSATLRRIKLREKAKSRESVVKSSRAKVELGDEDSRSKNSEQLRRELRESDNSNVELHSKEFGKINVEILEQSVSPADFGDPDDRDSSDTESFKIDRDPDLKEFVKTSLQNLNNKQYTCKVCDETFPSRIRLYNHRRTEHIAPGICNICGATIRADNLRRHVQMHSDNPAKCQDCGKTFKNSESLRSHTLIHKGEIYTCEVCGKQSKVKSEHGRHMKIHLDPNVGKTMCTICAKTVKDMKRHMLVHTGERPYSCSYCEKGFTSPNALKVHTRQHTKEKPYRCNICETAFAQKVSLVTHLKSKHRVVRTLAECFAAPSTTNASG